MKRTFQQNVAFSLLFLGILFIAGTVEAANKNSSGGFIDFNVYPYLSDVDSDNVVTINIAAKLKNRFSYFSLTNFSSQPGAGGDTVNYYTEQNLRWQMWEGGPLDLTLQLNFRSGNDNDRHRIGVRWRLNNTAFLEDFFKQLNLAYSINFHVVQFDHEEAYVWQMEHVFRMTFPKLTDRLYLAGFMDHTFNQDLPTTYPKRPIVGEVQLGFRLIGNLYAIAEYRLNEYRRSDTDNLAAGLEYIVKW